jgi:thiol-disulfide isomerase/thioredoxin
MGESLNETTLKLKSEALEKNEMIVIKFTADWCGPCKNIKDLCIQFEKTKPSSIQYYEINIDESLELYMKLKKMKMVNGIPALLAYKGGTKEYWYIPDEVHLGSDKKGLLQFFDTCVRYVSGS